jgi:hypothetical protein
MGRQGKQYGSLADSTDEGEQTCEEPPFGEQYSSGNTYRVQKAIVLRLACSQSFFTNAYPPASGLVQIGVALAEAIRELLRERYCQTSLSFISEQCFATPESK